MKKIVIIGPESTGKSTLCQQLADHYKTAWCPEYAREYLNQHNGKYTYEDLFHIAMGQQELENKTCREAANDIYFIDTDMLVMKVWCEVVFDNCHKWILKQAAIARYDLYLLCNTDIEWVKDELREYPDLAFRRKLFKMYKDILINQETPWVEISGIQDQRFQLAVKSINSIMNTN